MSWTEIKTLLECVKLPCQNIDFAVFVTVKEDIMKLKGHIRSRLQLTRKQN
jgi:hypothetical protein